MKKNILLILAIASLSLIVGCSTEENEKVELSDPLDNIKEREDKKEEANTEMTFYRRDMYHLEVKIAKLFEEIDMNSSVWLNELKVELSEMERIIHKMKDVDNDFVTPESYEITMRGADKLLVFVKGMEQVIKFEGLLDGEDKILLTESMKSYDEGMELMNEAMTKRSEELKK